MRHVPCCSPSFMKTTRSRAWFGIGGILSFVLASSSAIAACSDDASDPAKGDRDSGTTPEAGAIPDVTKGDEPDTGDPNDGFTDAEWATIKTLGPLPAVPKDPTNQYADNASAAKLGQMLFFDKSYSGALVVGDDGANGGLGAATETGKVACASCHVGAALIDTRSKPGNVSLGTDHGTRNALAVVNSSFYPWTNWGGRFDSQWSLPPAVAENAKIMASTRLAIAHLMWNKYKTEYEAIFGALDPALDANAADAARFPAKGKPKASAGDPDGPWELMTAGDRTIVNRIFANYGKAIQAYQRKLVSGNAALDKYIAGDRTALSDSAKRGLHLFIGTAGCVQCHSGPTLSDGAFHALVVPQTGPKVPAVDLGRHQDVPTLLASPFNTSGAFSDDTTTGKLTGLAQNDTQRGQFRTPSLRNVALTAPYMHSGQHATLAEVIVFYSAGGGTPDAGADGGDAGVPVTKDALMKPFGLVGTDALDLEAFMKALTGDPLPAPLTVDLAK